MLTALPTASIMTGSLVRLWKLFPFSEFFDNPGQSLIQSAEDLLSWFRIGRYLQCPPRKEPLDTRSATRVHRVASCERSVRAVRFPRTQASRREDCVNCVERPVDQIHNFQFGEQCRESLSIDTRQDKRASRENKGEDGEWKKCDRLRWVPKKKLSFVIAHELA